MTDCAITPLWVYKDCLRSTNACNQEVIEYAMSRRQGVYWVLTIPHRDFTPYPVPGCQWIKGQLECGEGGFLHWQILVATHGKTGLAGIKGKFGESTHAELSRSPAASAYVWKELTRVDGTQFEFGSQPLQRNSATDWERVWKSAQSGDLSEIPANIRVVSYRTLCAIGARYTACLPMGRTTNVFWGHTGTGKSRLAWEQAGMDAYSKDPRSKFWDGYDAQENAVFDEFRGGIDIAHLLRWTDRYPVRVEVKGSSRPLAVKNIWITSNIDPRRWYPDIDEETVEALMRRLKVTHFPAPL